MCVEHHFDWPAFCNMILFDPQKFVVARFVIRYHVWTQGRLQGVKLQTFEKYRLTGQNEVYIHVFWASFLPVSLYISNVCNLTPCNLSCVRTWCRHLIFGNPDWPILIFISGRPPPPPLRHQAFDGEEEPAEEHQGDAQAEPVRGRPEARRAEDHRCQHQKLNSCFWRHSVTSLFTHFLRIKLTFLVGLSTEITRAFQGYKYVFLTCWPANIKFSRGKYEIQPGHSNFTRKYTFEH